MRTIVLGGPGGQLVCQSVRDYRDVQAGRLRRVERIDGRLTATYLSDARRDWVPLFTFDQSRASVAAAYAAVLRRFELVAQTG